MSTQHPTDDAWLTDPRRLPEPRGSRLARVTADQSARQASGRVDGLAWRRLASVVRRFKWIVLGVTLVGTAAGVAASALMDPTYRARATLWIEVPDVRTRDQGPFQSGQLLGSSGWVDLLKSHVVLHDVVRERRLYLSSPSRDASALATLQVTEQVRPGAYRLSVSPDGVGFTLSTDEGRALHVGKVGGALGADLGFTWVPPATELTPGRTIEFSVATPAAAAQRLADQIRVQTDLADGKVGNFMRLEMRGSNPARITLTVNAVAERFVAVAADLKRQKLTELVGILANLVGHAQRNLQSTEQALRVFRVGAVTLLASDGTPVEATAGGRDPVFTSFFEMRVTREQLRRDVATLERVLAQLPDSGLVVNTLELIPGAGQSSALGRALKERADAQAELRALRYRYTDEHPPVRRLAEGLATLERQTIPLLVRGLVDQLRTRQAALGLQLDSAAGGLRKIPPLALQEARLRRDVTFAEQLFANIRQRYEEARLAEVSSIPEVRILDRAAQPQAPVFDAAPMLIVIALVGSCGLGVLGVVVLDRTDARVRYPDQVTEAMGLTILGAVPHVSRGNGADAAAAPVIEALRAVRLRVVHAHDVAGPFLATVTSPGKGEGKSFVASNLALAFSDAGYRTLLIDGDIRRGTLHRVLQAQRKPGLTDLLAGTAARDDVIRSTSHRGLSFIGCGARTHVGPELLASPAMGNLINTLRSSYDAILVDSPPLAAGVDAYALGTTTGAMLLVLRTGLSDRRMAEAKLDVLDRLPVRVLGAVLNDVRLGGEYRYYSYYMAGYELNDDEPNWAGRPVLRGPG